MRFLFEDQLDAPARAALDAHLSGHPDPEGWAWRVSFLWTDDQEDPGPNFAVVLRAHGDFFRAFTIKAERPEAGSKQPGYTIVEHRTSR